MYVKNKEYLQCIIITAVVVCGPLFTSVCQSIGAWPWLINPYNYLKSKIIPTCKQNLGILLYLVSLQSSKVAETNAKRTCSRRREHCYDDQANQDPKDAKHSTQNTLGGFVSIAENWRDTENSIQQINANFVWDSDLG